MEKIGNFVWYDLAFVESTNDEAAKMLETTPQKLLVTAQTQTAGRGRRGRSWVSMKGNLFCSMAYQAELKDLGQLVILSGLSVAQTIRRFIPKARVEVKWPNDVLVDGCKISGILFEHAMQSWWIMGVGINIVSAPEKQMMYPTMSLRAQGSEADRLEVLHCFVAEFEALYERWKTDGFEPVRKSWLDMSYKHAKNIRIQQEDTSIEGIFESIDDNGSLLLRTPEGVRTVIVGDVY